MSAHGERGPRPVGESVPRLLGRLGLPASTALMEAVFTRWEEVAGTELGAHARPLRFDGHALVVAVDHAAWATRVRMESARILSRVNDIAEVPFERLEVVIERR
jgi:predicted nucleic acid-binding Zn ribbon protein